MSYREQIYSSYVSAHTAHLYGEISLKLIESQFPVFAWYYKRFLPAATNAAIFEIGCGNGSLLYWLGHLGYTNISGVDISSEQVALAAQLGIPNVEVRDFRDALNVASGQRYDCIFARDVLEHLSKDEVLELLELAYTALNRKGVLVVETCNGEGIFGGRYRYADFTHELAFTKESLRQVLTVANFREICCYPTGPVPKGLKSGIRYFLWKGIEWLLRFYLLVETGSKNGILTQTIIAVGKK